MKPLLNTLQDIILDNQETALFTGVRRHVQLGALPDKALVCIGVRRCGKSTALHQVMRRLLDGGVDPRNLLYVNFFDDRLHALNRGNIGLVEEAYFLLYPEKKRTERIYCFFDEIQVVEGWEPFVDRMRRSGKCEIYITGSSSKLLSTDVATQMRGRSLCVELFPFSFSEALDWDGIDHRGALSSRKQLIVRKHFARYWQSGGFPEVHGVDARTRVAIHQEYLKSIVLRDVVERHDAPHPRAISDLAHRLIDSVGSMYSINKLTGYLKSLGHKVPKMSVSAYLTWFEDAFFLFSVRLFDASLSRSHANPRKVYCVDHGMARSCASGVLVNEGHLLENLVFIALRRVFSPVFYYRTHSGREVDFVVCERSPAKQLIQVCETIAGEETRGREVAALVEAMTEQKLMEGTIVTRDEQEIIEVPAGTIRVVPIWRFLLELHSAV